MNKSLETCLTTLGFKSPTVIQSKAFDVILEGRDAIAVSKTGTGKTYAYLFPTLNRIDTTRNTTQLLILVPTMELVKQVVTAIQPLKPLHEGLRIKGVSKGSDRLAEGAQHPHVVVGTLGRLNALFVEEAVLQLQNLSMVVIDEADMMLEKSTLVDLDALMDKLTPSRQTLVFSATVPDNLKTFIKQYLNRPLMIQVDEDAAFDPKVKHVLIPLKHRDAKAVLALFEVIRPYVALIFFNHLDELNAFSQALNERALRHLVLHGKLSARERQQNLTLIRQGQVSYVLSTDLAARGIDIPEISDVISVGLPKDLDFYVHRSGRTGRAGRSGTSYVFYTTGDDAGIRNLINRGIAFEHRNLSQGDLKPLRPYGVAYAFKKKEADKEISRLVNSKPVQVKPGYKKKREQEIEKLKRRKRREIIQASIKAQHKQKNKIKQIEKGNQSD
jgi:ATP-dependent RNA helicase CshB